PGVGEAGSAALNVLGTPRDEWALATPTASRGCATAFWLALGVHTRLARCHRVVRAPRQGLSPSRRENRRPLGARDGSPACAGVAAGRACSIQAIEAVCCLWMQGNTGIEPRTLRLYTILLLPTTALCVG